MRIYSKLSLKERFEKKISYEPMSGCWLWVGATYRNGYGEIGGGGKFGRTLLAHRVAWELSNGPIPTGLYIDHLCHNILCVNPSHLRLATPGENMHNSCIPITNKSGFKGVSWDSQRSKWAAYINKNRKCYNLGRFDTPEEAHAAYCEAARRLHGKFANYGEVS